MGQHVKVLSALSWANGEEARLLLGHLCDIFISAPDFINLANQHNVMPYVEGIEILTGEQVLMGTFQVQATEGKSVTISADQKFKVMDKMTLERDRDHPDSFYVRLGMKFTVALSGLDTEGEAVTWRQETTPIRRPTALFASSDIKALANIINGTEQPEADADEAEQLRRRIAELKALTDQQAQRIAELEAETERTTGAGDLVFPYATPELLAMQEAAVKYWVGYNAETDRKPQQKEIGIELTEVLGLNSSDGQTPRKAVELAIAIQPEQYRGRARHRA